MNAGVRLSDGSLQEAVISREEALVLAASLEPGKATNRSVDAEKLRLLIESARVRLAYTHDRQFAVSLSGIRTLPHQIEAVYQRMLPQPRLRFLLADDPGAGKTIMAGLLIKELTLREAIERVLILCPAPLTIQWQDEMLRWFGEPFEMIFSAVDQQQLVNPWQRASKVIASIDYAKQEDVRERIWQQRWDLVIIDEAHKCSARTTSGGQGREPKVNTTKRYELASRLSNQADHLLLLTATPHHGDEDKFAHFLRLIDPDLFPEPHRLGEQAETIRKDVFRLGENCPWALRRLKEDLKDLDGKRQKDRCVAMKMVAPTGQKRARFEVVESKTEGGLGFNPEAFSKGGNAVCPFCGTVADFDYVQAEGCAKRVEHQLMAIACARDRGKGKVYVSADEHHRGVPDEEELVRALDSLTRRSGLTVPNEPISSLRPSPNARGLSAVTRHGLNSFADLFTSRQKLCLLSFCAAIRQAGLEMKSHALDSARANALVTFLAAILDRLADFNSSVCVFNYTGGRGVVHTFGRHAIPMVWDFAETNPFNPEAASWASGIEDLPKGLGDAEMDRAARVSRGSAIPLRFPDSSMDAVITDPPYYDNVPYADISDFFYVWLRRTIGELYPEHFASELTPKKAEATALSSRHAGNMSAAEKEYEHIMSLAFVEAHRVLKPGATMTVVYAHKTTLGWARLVDALRKTGFTVTEAWPLDTEKEGRLLAQETAALASSIFLVARKRIGTNRGSYEEEVRPELDEIVRERVDTLWRMGITGADLIIAAIGAGLRAFTRFARVEYANGEEVPAEKFLAEVEGVVLETLLEKIFGMARSGVSAVDASSRFYVLWRYAYRVAELDAGEAIVFTMGQHVELEGPLGLSTGSHALVERKKTNTGCAISLSAVSMKNLVCLTMSANLLHWWMYCIARFGSLKMSRGN